jgi:ABC-type multidrug transport system fused ATPase/permease subunit
MLKHMMGILRSRPVVAVLLGAVGLWCVASSSSFGRVTYYSALSEKAGAVLDESLAKNLGTFVLVSGLKSCVAVIEGSSVGVGFELEVGDLVQPVYDYIDFFWKMFLFAFLVLGFYKLLLDMDLLTLGINIAGLGLLFLCLSLYVKRGKRACLLVGKRCVLFGLLLAYLVPVALLLTDFLSTRYTNQLKEKHEAQIVTFNDELTQASEEFQTLRHEISFLQPGESWEEVRSSLSKTAAAAREAFDTSLSAFVYYALILIVELLLFPFLSAYLLYKFAHQAMESLFEAPWQKGGLLDTQWPDDQTSALG